MASLKKAGIDCAQTKVGDRFVYECMQENNYALGGEQSGHIILKKYATTGDGLLTAIMIAEEMRDRKSALSTLAEPVMLYPQYLVNLRVKDKNAVMEDTAVLESVKDVEKLIEEAFLKVEKYVIVCTNTFGLFIRQRSLCCLCL